MAVFIAYFGIKETQFHRTVVREEDIRGLVQKLWKKMYFCEMVFNIMHWCTCQCCHRKCFSSKVIVKDLFLHNGGQHNAFLYVSHSSHS